MKGKVFAHIGIFVKSSLKANALLMVNVDCHMTSTKELTEGCQRSFVWRSIPTNLLEKLSPGAYHRCVSRIHVCHREIQGLSCGCSLSHSLFRERRNLAVLSQYDIVPTNLAFACCSVLHLGEDPCSVYQNSSSHRASFVEGKTAISGPSAIGFGVQTLNWNTPTMIAAKGFIHVDKPEAPICLSFLVGTCKLGKRCSNHHCSLPYHWQYKVPINDVWNSFSDEDNVALERLYCDVNNTQMEFKPVETLDFSLTESILLILCLSSVGISCFHFL